MQPALLFSDDQFGNRSYFQEVAYANGQVQYIPVLSPSDQECFARQMMQQQIDLVAMKARKETEQEYLQRELGAKEAYHARVEEQKTKARINQAKALEQIRMKRERMQVSAIQDSSGYMRLEYIDPDGKEPASYSNPIMAQKFIRMSRFWTPDSDEKILYIKWFESTDEKESVGDRKERIIILSGDSGLREFHKALGKAGVDLKVRNERKEAYFELLFGYLMSHSEDVMIASFFGWNKTEDGSWHFSDENEKLFSDFKEVISR